MAISPNTAPGTLVVASDEAMSDPHNHLPTLVKERIYCVERMCWTDEGRAGVYLAGIHHPQVKATPRWKFWIKNRKIASTYVYSHTHFDLVVEQKHNSALPESITKLLDVKKPAKTDA
jgi:hypothetical protein